MYKSNSQPWSERHVVIDSRERNPYLNTAFYIKGIRGTKYDLAQKASHYINGVLRRMIWRSRREGNA